MKLKLRAWKGKDGRLWFGVRDHYLGIRFTWTEVEFFTL